MGFGQGNYKRLKAYFQHLLSTYNDLASEFGIKIQKGIRQMICLQGAHSGSNEEDGEIMKIVSHSVANFITELWEMNYRHTRRK